MNETKALELQERAKKFYVDQCALVLGKRLVNVRSLTQDELEIFGWEHYGDGSGIVMIFEDGQALIPCMDPEMNGPGFMEQVEMEKSA
jgi:hypothetical protein